MVEPTDIDTVRRGPAAARGSTAAAWLLWPTATLAGLWLLFWSFPGLDLAVSGIFAGPNGGFPATRSSFARFVRDLGSFAVLAAAVAYAAPPLLKVAWPRSRIVLPPRLSLYGLSALALGPGLVVNVLLKEHWGRARPRDIAEFGGDAAFTAFWRLSDACRANCSFASGEAAGAFWLTALVLIVPADLRRVTAAATLAVAALVALSRIAMGGHFLSDVAFAWFITSAAIALAYSLAVRQLPESFDSRAESALATAGFRLRELWRKSASGGK